MPRSASADLRQLSDLEHRFGGGAARRKLEALLRLERATLPSAADVLQLHETLCFWRAYPENREVLDVVERMLERFDRRRDLRKHRAALSDTGIAGTDLHFRFYWLMAIRLLHRWPDQLAVDWGDFENAGRLVELLHLLVPDCVTPAVDEVELTARQWVERLRKPEETDAAWLLRRFDALRVARQTREHLYEKLDVPLRIAPGDGTPERSREKWPASPVVFQTKSPSRARPSLRRAMRSAEFELKSLPRPAARGMIDLANSAMVPRHRDLLVFLHGDENDVRLFDFGDGLQLALIGAMPDRRLMLEAVYGLLTLKNGVPIGYVLASSLFGSCELAYNVFESFRGAEAGVIYSRFVAAMHHLFGADTFAIDPYQLGHHNREGQRSGAWWFYYKFGFRPRDPEIRALVREELQRIKRRGRGYRTGVARLNRLAADSMFFSLVPGQRREDVLGRVSLGAIGLRAGRYLARRFGGDVERGIRTCARESAELLELRDLRRLPPGERLAWDRWGPLVLALPGIERWSAADRRALAAVVRAKGGRRESEFVRRFDRHRRLRRAVLALAEPDEE